MAEDSDGDPPAGEPPPPDRPAGASAAAGAAGRGGASLREIAVRLYGAARVDAEWHADSAMRTGLRRLPGRGRACRG